MNCFASNLYTDESGRICTWFPANEMAERLGVAERTIFKAVGSLKQRGFLKEKKRACYGRCAEYWFMPNNGTLKQPKEKALTGAAANADNNGSVAFPSSIHASRQTHDSIIPIQGIELVENGRYLSCGLSHADGGKPVSSDNTIGRKQLEEFRKSGALSNGI